MGENREGARRRADDSRRDDGDNVGDKILDFGRGLWKKGSKAVDGAVDKIKSSDGSDLERQAGRLGDQARQLGQGALRDGERQARQLGQGALRDGERQTRQSGENTIPDNDRQPRGMRGRSGDQPGQGRGLAGEARDLASKARDLAGSGGGLDLKGLNLKDLDVNKVAGVAGMVAFPQLELLNRGSKEFGGLVARKQAKLLLEDPQTLADKMVVNFDVFDTDNSGYLTKEKLSKKGSLLGIADDQASLGFLMTAGFTPLNKLDGDESRKGLSRDDIQTFKLLYDKEALSNRISSEAWGTAAWSGALGGLAGGGGSYLMRNALQAGAGRIGMIAVGTATVVGGLAYILSRNSQSNYYEEKRTEMDAMIKTMKSAF